MATSASALLRQSGVKRVDPDAPRYRLTEKAYIEDTLYEIDDEIEFHDKPGWHMAPLNKAAEAKIKEHWPNGMTYNDPILAMTDVTKVDKTEMQQLAELLMGMQKAA